MFEVIGLIPRQPIKKFLDLFCKSMNYQSSDKFINIKEITGNSKRGIADDMM